MVAASADTLGALVRIAGLVLRYGLAHALLLARNIGYILDDDRGGNEAISQRERWHSRSRTHPRIGIGEMSVHNMKFVVVNNMAPRNPSVCAACSRPLDRGYLHDLSTSRRYCGVECYPRWVVLSGSVAATNPFELAVAWPKLTVDVASALFDSTWGDHRG
jgi:hypothetical protein